MISKVTIDGIEVAASTQIEVRPLTRDAKERIYGDTRLNIASGRMAIPSTPSEPNQSYEIPGESILKSLREQEVTQHRLHPHLDLTKEVQRKEQRMYNQYPIALANDWSWDHPELPRGEIWIRNTKFNIAGDGERLIGMSVVPTNQNELAAKDIYPGIDGARALIALLNTSFGLRTNGRVEWEGCRIGAIDILDKNGQHYIEPLHLGHNIRDWCPGVLPHAVFKLRTEHACPAWASTDLGSSFDLLEICFPEPVNIVRISIQAQMDLPGPAKPAELHEMKAKIKKGKKPKVEIVRKKIAEQFPSINIIAMTAIK